jgi:hypothetical protein
MQWTNECFCNLGKPSFDAIGFITKNSKIEIVCNKCLGVICWWPISTEQKVLMAARGINKLSAIPPTAD